MRGAATAAVARSEACVDHVNYRTVATHLDLQTSPERFGRNTDSRCMYFTECASDDPASSAVKRPFERLLQGSRAGFVGPNRLNMRYLFYGRCRVWVKERVREGRSRRATGQIATVVPGCTVNCPSRRRLETPRHSTVGTQEPHSHATYLIHVPRGLKVNHKSAVWTAGCGNVRSINRIISVPQPHSSSTISS